MQRGTFAMADRFRDAPTMFERARQLAVDLGETAAYELMRDVIGACLREAFCHLEFEGTDHVPEFGPALLVANHRSILDPFLIGFGLERHLHFVADSWVHRLSLAHLLTAAGVIFLPAAPHRSEGLIDQAVPLLRTGQAVAIFPEGMDNFAHPTTPCSLGGFHTAFARLWWAVRDLEVPIVPVAVRASDRQTLRMPIAWLRWLDPANPAFAGEALYTALYRHAAIRFGAPIAPPRRLARDATIRHLTQLARQAIENLLAPP